MTHLFHRNVVLGVCGGIAAYKSAELIRGLQAAGATVRVIMTRGATEFITPLTLQALSGFPIHTSLLDEEAERGMGHIELARWADLLIVAPATADLLSRLAHGRADDLLTTVSLATSAPKLLAPAMNQQMWRDPATAANVEQLVSRGFRLAGPDTGEQACGDVGPGRMISPEAIVAAADALFERRSLEGRQVVITAGPTREAIDPVRYISNHSSGKMGFALARAAAEAGALTHLVTGPVALETPARVERHDVVSARDMLEQCLLLAPDADIFIGCAAVSDYRPADIAGHKIKKGDGEMTLRLVPNPDIISAIAALPDAPFTVGFAAETRDVERYAKDKLARKGLDMIVANDVGDSSIGFNSDSNAVTVFTPDSATEIPIARKDAIARQLIDLIAAGLDRAVRDGGHQVAGVS